MKVSREGKKRSNGEAEKRSGGAKGERRNGAKEKADMALTWTGKAL
jgi:hypothetical protein